MTGNRRLGRKEKLIRGATACIAQDESRRQRERFGGENPVSSCTFQPRFVLFRSRLCRTARGEPEETMINRRDFLRSSSTLLAGLALNGQVPARRGEQAAGARNASKRMLLPINRKWR